MLAPDLGLVLHSTPCWTHYGQFTKQIVKVNTAEPEISFLILYPLLPFQNLLPTLPTMQQPLTDITRGSLIDDMQLSLELKKTLYYFFSFFFLTYALVLPQTCKHI